MPDSRLALRLALCLAASLGSALPARAATFCDGRPANVPLDLNGNGAPDTVCVSDYDHDGTLEIDDLQDAVAALTDPVGRSVYVLPGSYAPPPLPGSRPGRGASLLELPSHTSLICESPGTVLHGPAGTDTTQDYAVIGNADQTLGDDDVLIRGCEVNGGAPDSYDGKNVALSHRVGIYFRRTRNSRVENTFVHHTFHTGLYTSNSRGDQFTDNRIEDAGGYGNATSFSPPYPCIYVYSFSGESVEDFVATGNTMKRCTATGLNTRTENYGSPGAGIHNTLWENNWIQDTGHAVGQGGAPGPTGSVCMSIRGVDGMIVRHNFCVSTGGIAIYNAAGYASNGDLDSVKNTLIEDLVLSNVDAVAGIYVGAHAENLTLRNVHVLSTRDDAGNYLPLDCFQLLTPLRGALFEDLELRNCGGSGIYEMGTLGEELTFRRLTINRVDLADPTDTQTHSGLHLRGPHKGLVLEDVSSNFASRSEIEFERHLEDSRLERVQVDATNPGWLGSFPEASAPACVPARARKWITTTNGQNAQDCSFSPGTTGSTPVRCRCNGSSWSWYPPDLEQPGIVFGDADAPSARVVLRDVEVKNARDLPGVRMTAPVTQVQVTNLTGADDSPATDLDQNSAIQVLDSLVDIAWNGVQCVGTDPTRPCIEVLRDAFDWDGDGVPNASDNCISTPNPDQTDFDRDGAGAACDPDDDNDLLLDVYETGTGHYVSAKNTGTNPQDADSDHDGSLDGIEVQAGSDPNNPASRPNGVPALGAAGAALCALALLATAARRLRR